jgi:carbon storage regulator CsrA
MLVLTRKNRESIVIGRPEDLEVVLEITILEIEGGRVRLGFEADTRMPIHRREVWDRICNGNANGNGNGSPTGTSRTDTSGIRSDAPRQRPATLDVDIETARRS